ncbi:unnamed protein product, partial [Discosporangium mesarthrocarpum]
LQTLSSLLLDKQARLEGAACERVTLSAKLKEATGRAARAEAQLGELRGDSLEGGFMMMGQDLQGEGGVRQRRRLDRRGSGGIGGPGPGTWSQVAPIAKHKKV